MFINEAEEYMGQSRKKLDNFFKQYLNSQMLN
jgi:hypothetical protein